MDFDYHTVVRLLNVFMAAGLIILAVLKARILWPQLHFPARLMYCSYMAIMGAVAYGTTEVLAEDIKPGLRVSVAAAALLMGVISFLWPDPPLRWMLFWYKLRKK